MEKTDILQLLPDVPIDKVRGVPLLTLKQPQRRLEEIILPTSSKSAMEALLEEYRRDDVLHSYGLRCTDKVMFYGNSGCGKTLAAEVIAFELDRPLAIVRLDAIIAACPGEAAAKLEKVFNFMAQHALVVLFDNLEAFAKAYVNSQAYGAPHWMMAIILQMMDFYQGQSLILAATNYAAVLTATVWRCFDESIAFPLPDPVQIGQLLKLKLRGVRHQIDLDDDDLMAGLAHKSGADIDRLIRYAVKQMILRGQTFLTMEDVKNARDREDQRVLQ